MDVNPITQPLLQGLPDLVVPLPEGDIEARLGGIQGDPEGHLASAVVPIVFIDDSLRLEQLLRAEGPRLHAH